jgi:hypothetical protein
MEVLKEAIDAGKIKNVGEAYTDGWKPENAQKNMEQFLTANDNKVDAVVASNDGTAGGAIAALAAQGLAGSVPVSGQDGDHAALNRIALGTQTVSVWKDAANSARSRRNRPRTRRRQEDGRDRRRHQIQGGPKGVEMKSVFLAPVADHQGQPQRRHRRRLGHQGRGRARACRRFGRSLQLRSVRPSQVGRNAVAAIAKMDSGVFQKRGGLDIAVRTMGPENFNKSGGSQCHGRHEPHACPSANDGRNPVNAFFNRATELDTRLLGMVGALLLIWIGFISCPAACS